MRLRLFIVLAVLALLPLGCSGSSNPCSGSAASPRCTRVLFVGNSYTYVNNLPNVFAGLAASGGHQVATGMLATGGATLADHVRDPATATTLTSTSWNAVVLQEQSEIPSSGTLWQSQMYPAAAQLVGMVRQAGAVPILFLTWAHREGWPETGLLDYRSMQEAIDGGYLAVARRQDVSTAPVGLAWSALLGRTPQADLWQDDGSHPTLEGTYLAACVFYATIFGQSPRGLTYLDGLSDDTAAEAQEVAADVVLGDPTLWVARLSGAAA